MGVSAIYHLLPSGVMGDTVRFCVGARRLGALDYAVVIEAEEDLVSIEVSDSKYTLTDEDARWLADALHAACSILRRVRPIRSP